MTEIRVEIRGTDVSGPKAVPMPPRVEVYDAELVERLRAAGLRVRAR